MRILVTGASGKLGSYLLAALNGTRHSVAAWSHAAAGTFAGYSLVPVDLADRDKAAAAFQEARPEVVLHTAAQSNLAGCLADPDRAKSINVGGTRLLAELSAEAGGKLVFVSTDMVFNGQRGGYREADEIDPVSLYGTTKAAADQEVLAYPEHLVVRVSLMFGPALGQRLSFFDQILSSVVGQTEITLFHDEWRTPLSMRTAASALLAAAAADAAGLYHLGGPEKLSRYEMGLRLAAHLRLPADRLRSISAASLDTPEPRPPDLSLDSSRFRADFPQQSFPNWEQALSEMGVAPS